MDFLTYRNFVDELSPPSSTGSEYLEELLETVELDLIDVGVREGFGRDLHPIRSCVRAIGFEPDVEEEKDVPVVILDRASREVPFAGPAFLKLDTRVSSIGFSTRVETTWRKMFSGFASRWPFVPSTEGRRHSVRCTI